MHSFNSCLMHCVFSVEREARALLTRRFAKGSGRISAASRGSIGWRAAAPSAAWRTMCTASSVPATLAVSKAMQLLKGNSSKWLRGTFPELHAGTASRGRKDFGAFSIGVSGLRRHGGDTSGPRRSITGTQDLRRGGAGRFCKGTDTTQAGDDATSLLPSVTGLQPVLRSFYPALKRWAIFGRRAFLVLVLP